MTKLSILLESSGESMIVGILGGIVAVVFFSLIGRVNSGREKRKIMRDIEKFKAKASELGVPDLYDRFVQIYQFLTTIIPELSTRFVSDENGIYGIEKDSKLVIIKINKKEDQYVINVFADKKWTFNVNTTVDEIIETIKSDFKE